MPAKQEINLIPGKEWESTRLGQFLTWALSAGRYILIATEIVVIAAFLFRFKLDRDLTNLNEDIRQKQAIVAASADFEKEFRALQKRLQIIEQVEATSPQAAKLLDQLAARAPNEVFISKFSLTEGQVSFESIALSEAAMGSFLTSVQAMPELDNIELTRVTAGGEGKIGISFNVSATLVGQQF